MKRWAFGSLMLFLATATGFGIHQYSQRQGGLWGSLMDEIAGREKTVESEVPSLEAIEEKIQKLSQLAEGNDLASASQKASALLDQVDHAYSVLAEDPQLDETKLRRLRISTLHAKYAGAKVDRAQLAEPFRDFADRLIAEQPKSPEAAQAALLQLLVKHDLRQPAAQNLFVDLDDYATSYSQSLGAVLFCRVAQELVQNEQTESAKAVLQRGIRTYRSTPAAGKLVRQSVDLNLSKPPPPGFTQSDWDKAMRALECKATAAAMNNRGTPAVPKLGRT